MIAIKTNLYSVQATLKSDLLFFQCGALLPYDVEAHIKQVYIYKVKLSLQ
jgi:hypothetical protein